jgi:hypothetical protein
MKQGFPGLQDGGSSSPATTGLSPENAFASQINAVRFVLCCYFCTDNTGNLTTSVVLPEYSKLVAELAEFW